MQSLGDHILEYDPSQLLIVFVVLVSLSTTAYIFMRYDDGEQPVPFQVPIPEQSKPGWQGEILEHPSIKVPGSSAIQCYCPANGTLLGRVNPATPDGIDRAIIRAREAQRSWAKTTFSQRRRVLKTMLNYILANQEVIAHISCLDSGKTKIDASLGEILMTVEKLKWTIQHGEKALRPQQRPTNFLMMYKKNQVKWEPLGVVAACVSWNYPFHNLMNPIISTLFSGSALILKGSEQTAWSLSYTASIAKAALAACGHSASLIQPLVCWPATASHLTSHPSISHITFVGSRPVAHAVCASASKSLIPVVAELGGKDPAIVLDDVRDLEKVASILMRGVFVSAGQSCIGIERIIALPRTYSALVRILELRICSLRVGSTLDDPEEVDVGAMISDARFDHLERLIADAVAQGAKCLAGGTRYIHPLHPRGHYFRPTLLVDVAPSMRIAQEELFAPVCLLMRAGCVEDALAMANSTSYALGASVFGRNQVDLDKLVHGVRAGMVSVNDFAAYYAVQLPFGGTGGSGYGRFAGEEGLRGLCNMKSVCEDRWPGWVNTAIPATIDYPLRNARKGWELCQGLVELGYGLGWRARVGGLWRIAKNGL